MSMWMCHELFVLHVGLFFFDKLVEKNKSEIFLVLSYSFGLFISVFSKTRKHLTNWFICKDSCKELLDYKKKKKWVCLVAHDFLFFFKSIHIFQDGQPWFWKIPTYHTGTVVLIIICVTLKCLFFIHFIFISYTISYL